MIADQFYSGGRENQFGLVSKMSFYHNQPLISPEAFQELGRERSAERKMIVKEKRQEGRRRIVELKSRSGVNPLELFPKEIWMKIMEDINPEDRWNAWQVHPVFADLMEDVRIRDILFPRALMVILDYMKNSHGDETERRLSIPFLQLREVCKSLRLAVDRWFEMKIQEGLGKRPEEDWRAVPGMKLLHLSPNTTRLDGLIENFATSAASTDDDLDLAHAKSSKSFFLRSLEVVVSLYHLRTNVFLPFKSKMIRLLQLIGHQVLFFKLHVSSTIRSFDEEGITVADFYFILQEYCLLMPNLKRLDVRFELSEGMDPCDCCDWHGVLRLRPDVVIVIESLSFPTLSKLEDVGFAQDQNIFAATKIYDSILKANPHVKMLKLEMENKELEKMSQENLKSLNLELFSWYNPASHWFPRSNAAICRNWPLKTMELFSKHEDLKDVFKLLEEFPSLEKVTLYLIEVRIGSGIGFLHLPNLSHFHCDYRGKIVFEKDDVNFIFSLQFLLYAKKLKGLHWYYNTMHTNEGERETLLRYLESHECPDKMLDFRGGWRDLNSSNMWKIFPQLECVDIEFLKRSTWKTGIKQYSRPS